MPLPFRLIISIPIDLSDDAELAQLEEHGVKGRYTSVERLTELEDGTVEWAMATSSTPGGSIPAFVTERSMPGQIAQVHDPRLLWLLYICSQLTFHCL